MTDESTTVSMTPYQQFISLSRYARFLPEKTRRETWEETVRRYCDFFKQRSEYFPADDVFDAIYNLRVMPSMRALMTAGKALERDQVSGYNCAYVAVDDPRAFDETMYVLMCGTGIGFSVERQNVNKLPEIAEQFFDTDTVLRVKDSRMGWAASFRELINLLYGGRIPQWDMSAIRPAGAPLKTFGGRASGPQPLDDLFRFTVNLFKRAAGRKLTSLECHDLMCKVADIVVVGGVRRCLPADTSVHTKNGIKRIDQIVVGDLVLTQDHEYNNVIAIESTGFKQLWKIETQLGDYYSSAEHRWATLVNQRGDITWKEAQNITCDDVLVAINQILPGTATELPAFKYTAPNRHSTTCTNIVIPQLTSEISWFFGQLHADGYVSLKSNRGHVAIACSDDLPEQHDRVVACMQQFGVNVYVPPTHDERCSHPRAMSKQLAEYMYQFKQPNTTIDIPDFIKQGTENIRASYIAGVFDGDGHMPVNTTQKAYIVASSVYAKYLEQVRDLLASIGIFSKIRLARSTKDRWQAIYNLQVFGRESIDHWNRRVAPFSSKNRKYGCNALLVEQNSFVVPFQKQSQSFNGWQRQTGMYDNWRPVKVLSVQQTDIVERTYDIEVERSHNFVVGGGLLTHNSALLSLSNLSDDRMRMAKTGQWWLDEGQRALSNNSAAYTEKPTIGAFIREWLSLYDSKSGERGIFNRAAAKRKVRSLGPDRRKDSYEFGCNPCAEVLMRPQEFCNLSEVVIRPEDTLETLREKVVIATVLGTFQTTLVDFRYLRSAWKRNVEEERLLGVSLTGIMDHPVLSHVSETSKQWLTELRSTATETNKVWAEKLGITPSVAITTVKPSGTVSELVGCSSGIHPRFSRYYIRTVRNDKRDPLSTFMIESSVPHQTDVTKDTNWVFGFPVESPQTSRITSDMTAIDQLEIYLLYNQYWADHSISNTIYVREHEWLDVGAWVYKHFDQINGISFLPYTDTIYQQAPYQPITEQQYNNMIVNFPVVDFTKFVINEYSDNTTGTQTLACTSGNCEI